MVNVVLMVEQENLPGLRVIFLQDANHGAHIGWESARAGAVVVDGGVGQI